MSKTPIKEARWPSRREALGSRLFSPLELGPIVARTRTWVPAMVPWRATDEGLVTPEVLDWYERFARGKPGVLVVEATGIRDVQSGPLLRIGHDRFLPGLAELVERVRLGSEGQTRVLIQLIDFLSIRRRPERQKYLERFLAVDEGHRERLAALGAEPSAAASAPASNPEAELRSALVELPDAELFKVLTEREREALEFGHRERVSDTELAHIAELPKILPELFAQAASRARQAGFDGVELHYAHAYTMASFLSRTNDRRDGYGGSREGRVRLPLEVFQRVREVVGTDFCVGCRFLGDEVIAKGSDLEDACFFGEAFARAGFDFLSVSKGGKFDDAKQPRVGQAVYPYTGESGHECMPTVKIEGGPFGRNLPLARAIRARVRDAALTTPVVAAGGINSFELAESALTTGACDAIGAARQTLADPDWFLKMELGRGAEIRRCIFTNYCEGLDQLHRQVTCQLWDREFDLPDGVGGVGGVSEPPGALQRQISRSHDGKRRLIAPAWQTANDAESN